MDRKVIRLLFLLFLAIFVISIIFYLFTAPILSALTGLPAVNCSDSFECNAPRGAPVVCLQPLCPELKSFSSMLAIISGTLSILLFLIYHYLGKKKEAKK